MSDPNLRGTVKELAQLDGAFMVSHDGFVLSACRYLDAVTSEVELSLGLGSRHIAAANMRAVTNAVGVVVSESSVVRLFCHGKLVGEIIPELWMMGRTVQLHGPVKKETFGEVTVLTPSTRFPISKEFVCFDVLSQIPREDPQQTKDWTFASTAGPVGALVVAGSSTGVTSDCPLQSENSFRPRRKPLAHEKLQQPTAGGFEAQNLSRVPDSQPNPDPGQESEVVTVALPFSSLQLNPSLAKYLNLTPTQVEAIRQVMTREHSSVEPLITELRVTRDELLTIGSQHINKRQVKALADTEASLLARLIVANARMQSKMYKILSPAQQQKLSDLERTQSAVTSDGG